MRSYVALLRAVNVGGTGKLPMAELAAMGRACGFEEVRTFIASGNLLFRSGEDETEVRTRLETRLHAHAGKPVGVLVRTAAEMAGVVERDPFADEPGNRVIVLFLPESPTAGALTDVAHLRDERIAPGSRELYVSYGEGMASSRLRLAAERVGTGRNMNTVRKLAAMLAER